MKFGNYLYCQKDYLRAFEEYSEYLKNRSGDTVLFKISLALREMKRYSETEDYLKTLAFNSRLTERARVELFKTYFIENDFKTFKNEYKYGRYLPEKNIGTVKQLFYVSQLLWEDILPDSIDFVNAFQSDIKNKAAKFYFAKHYPDRKEEATAGLLSAIVPGLGKIYTGDYGDGITGFLFTAILGYIAYDNFRAGHNFRGGLFSGLTALFYGGNIYGSITSAQIYNAAADYKYEEELLNFVKEENYFDPHREEFCK